MRPTPFQMLDPGRPAWMRHCLAVVAWVCLVTQLSGVMHFLLVEHARCAEHGELIHGHVQHAERETDAHPGTVAPSSHLFVPAGRSEEHDHDHCLVASEKREAIATTPTLLSGPSAGEDSAVVADVSHELVLVARVYAFAPKTSPPFVTTTLAL